MQNDIYKTIENMSTAAYKEKGSRFLAFAFPVSNEEIIKEHLQNLKQKYYDATHRCFAWMLGLDENNYRINDDGEPSGTAGKPILGQIKSHEVTNILIVVVRYFGGTKLGTSGLIHAYKTAAAEALTNAKIIEKTVNIFYEISFDYKVLNDVMRIIKEENPKIINQKLDLNCYLKFYIRMSKSETILNKLKKIETLVIK
ncbi:MAG: YigZ family protein [Marinilabiliaceae bacterium]|nr:YigZ family protein [Marinilabiliaceae bacterium]